METMAGNAQDRKQPMAQGTTRNIPSTLFSAHISRSHLRWGSISITAAMTVRQILSDLERP
jgi:hypothetical protein